MRGCICKDEGLKCADSCTCGTVKAPCRNKPEIDVPAENLPAGRNAFERHEVAVTAAREEITVRSRFVMSIYRCASFFQVFTKCQVEKTTTTGCLSFKDFFNVCQQTQNNLAGSSEVVAGTKNVSLCAQL